MFNKTQDEIKLFSKVFVHTGVNKITRHMKYMFYDIFLNCKPNSSITVANIGDFPLDLGRKVGAREIFRD